jgi:hypothetical protein
MVGRTMEASTPMIMTTIITSMIVNPPCLLAVRIGTHSSRSQKPEQEISIESQRLRASAVPDRVPSNKPLISIMKQCEFHRKRMPHAAAQEPDFGRN